MEKLTGKESLIKYFYLAAMAFAMTAATACRSVENTQKKERTSMKENFTFYNIVPFANGEEKQTAADMIEYQKRTGNRIVLYSLTIHPEGYPARKKADQLFDSYRKLKKELAGSDVQLGILFQSILGHWPRVDKDEEKWTRTIDIDGKTPRFCPLDPGFRKYIYEVAVTAAKEKPVFIMGDDDIRGFSPKAECFCRRNGAGEGMPVGKGRSQRVREQGDGISFRSHGGGQTGLIGGELGVQCGHFVHPVFQHDLADFQIVSRI